MEEKTNGSPEIVGNTKVAENVFHADKMCSVKGRLSASAKNIDTCQPAQSAQADVSRYFLV